MYASRAEDILIIFSVFMVPIIYLSVCILGIIIAVLSTQKVIKILAIVVLSLPIIHTLFFIVMLLLFNDFYF